MARLLVRVPRGAALAAALAFSSSGCLANDAPLNLYGGAAKPMASGQTLVRMRSEVVVLTLGAAGYGVDVRFEFFNDGPSTTVAVGFPEAYGESYRYHGEPLGNFQTWVDEAPAVAREVAGSGTGGAEPYGWRVKDVAFPAAKVTRVRVRYDAAYYGNPSNIGDFNEASYLFGTGRGWNGAIGRALFVVKLTTDFPNALLGPSFRGVSGTFDVFRLTDRVFAFELKEFEPAADADLSVEFRYGTALAALGLDDCSTHIDGEECPPESKDFGRWVFAGKALPEHKLVYLALDDLRAARNAFFAGHGRTFHDAALTRAFSFFGWYKPVAEAKMSGLSAVEKQNAAKIGAYEEKLRAAFAAGKAPRYSCPAAPKRRPLGESMAVDCAAAGAVSRDSIIAGVGSL